MAVVRQRETCSLATGKTKEGHADVFHLRRLKAARLETRGLCHNAGLSVFNLV